MTHFLQRVFDSAPRFFINWWPPFWGAGIRVKHISEDFRKIEVVLKLHWFNRNYMGVHFGGSIYSMTDPFPMLMLIKSLGKDYIVWDKAAKINYIKPGRGTLYASFAFTDNEINAIREQADMNEKYIFDREIKIVDDQQELIATVIKTLYVRKKNKTQASAN